MFARRSTPRRPRRCPNLVDPDDLPTANALGGSLWGTMLAVGAALGGVVSTVFGRDVAFIVNAVSFAVSALLLVGIHRPFSAPREPDEERVGDHRRRPVEIVHYARRDRRVWALVSVKCGFGAAAGVLALIPVFGVDVFHAATSASAADGRARGRRAGRAVLRPSAEPGAATAASSR